MRITAHLREGGPITGYFAFASLLQTDHAGHSSQGLPGQQPQEVTEVKPHPHFTDEATEAQRGQVIPQSHTAAAQQGSTLGSGHLILGL
jgi:hypothetical protein